MFAMAGKSWVLYLAVCLLFLSNGLLASSSHDGRFPPSSSQPTLLSRQDAINVEVVENNCTTVIETSAGTQNTSCNDIPPWKQQLPFPLNNKTKTLQRLLIPGGDNPTGRDTAGIGCDVEVFLLGTAHVSKDSSRDVRQLLECVKPDAIFLELCHQRLNLLESSEENDAQEADNSNPEECIQTSNETRRFWKQCRTFFRFGKKTPRMNKKNDDNKRIDTRSFSSIASSLLSNMQGEYADSLEVELGGEFRAAYEYWKKVVPQGATRYRKVHRINNVHMILGDRPVSLTLARAWESLGIWGKIKVMVGLIISSVRKPNPDELREWMEKILYDDTDLMSESVTELAKHFPTLAEVILKERDAYMACKLHQTCRRLLFAGSRTRSNRRYRLVAIVGAGHVEGICRWLTTGGSVSSISTVPSSDEDQLPESPEDILSKLIQIKATISKEDHDYLVHQITEVDPELMSEFL
eukprot:CAMPEP_0116137026 /NCGR_PEP_ID=MMETSP0329-20121206/12040_1 /TAXON_ID=697910 /ORGANISM="Pseudo-nitzschia arenysensis, Strain B593" /LENGTH=465 /DNA_ID=CAMNT_0003631937 /DNA_START=41 /DNA_END=1438 /DNA_ORIENTATION=+